MSLFGLNDRRKRTYLSAYFTTGSVPSQDNFGSFIGSTANLEDGNIFNGLSSYVILSSGSGFVSLSSSSVFVSGGNNNDFGNVVLSGGSLQTDNVTVSSNTVVVSGGNAGEVDVYLSGGSISFGTDNEGPLSTTITIDTEDPGTILVTSPLTGVIPSVVLSGGNTGEGSTIISGGNLIVNSDTNSILVSGGNSGSSILGGNNNVIAASGAFIGGGTDNLILSGAINGTIVNATSSNIFENGEGASIITGTDNTIGVRGSGNLQTDPGGINSVILGGRGNVIKGDNSLIGIGCNNVAGISAGDEFVTILNGCNNFATGRFGTVIGGAENKNYVSGGFIGGGFNNSISMNAESSDIPGQNSAIIGGMNNGFILSAYNSVTLGGVCNGNSGCNAVIIGGFNNNLVQTINSTILGGCQNNINTEGHRSSVIAGAHNNVGALVFDSVVVGGQMNGIASMSNSEGINKNAIIGGSYNCFSRDKNPIHSSVIAGGTNVCAVSSNMLHANTLYLSAAALPTSDPGVPGVVYRDGTTLKISV